MDDFDQLDDTIKALQEQLQGLQDEDEDNFGNDLQKQIKQLQNQLEQDQKTKKPDPTQINTFIAIQQFMNLAQKQQDKQYFLKLLTKKQKLLSLVKQGKITSTNYKIALQKIDITKIQDPTLVKHIQNQILIQTKLANTQIWFKKITQKLQATLPNNIQYKNSSSKQNQQKKQKQIKEKPVVIKQKPKTAEQKQKQLILRLDGQSIQRKAQMLLRQLSKIQSLICYYNTHIKRDKQKQILSIWNPKKQNFFKIIDELQSGKNVPIANFYLNNLFQISLQQFHGKSKKQYLLYIDTIIKKYKSIQKTQKEFNKKCSKSTIQGVSKDSYSESAQLLKCYEQDINYLQELKKKKCIILPIVNVRLQERSNFIENSFLQKNDLQILIKRINGLKKDKCLLKIYFEQMQNARTILNISNGDQNINVIIKLTNDNLKQINKKQLIFKIQSKTFKIFTKQQASFKITFSQFLNKNSIQSIINQSNIQISYIINIKSPRNKNTLFKIQTISLQKFPQYIHTNQFQQQFLKKHYKFQQSTTIKPPSTIIYAKRNQSIINKLKNLKSTELSQQIIQKPEIYSDSYVYLSKQDQILDKQLNEKFEYKKNKQIIQQIQDQVIKKKMIIQGSRKTGKISSEKYVQLIQNNVKQDKILLKIYSQDSQLEQFVKFINLRLQFIAFQLSILKPKDNNKKKVDKINLSTYNLIYVKRTDDIKKIFNKLTESIDSITVNNIKNPESFSFSLMYLTEMDKILDNTINDTSIDRLNRRLAQQLQDEVIKQQALINKQKGSLNEEQYKALILSKIQNDKKLIKIYKKLGLSDFTNFIYAKIKICKKQVGQNLILQIQDQANQDLKKQQKIQQKKNEQKFDLSEQKQLFQIERNQKNSKKLEKLQQDLKNPEYPQYCSCLTYIQKMLQITKNDILRQKLQKMKERFEEEINNERFDQQRYVQNLKRFKGEDLKRMQRYKEQNLKEFYLFIKARLKIIEEQENNF